MSGMTRILAALCVVVSMPAVAAAATYEVDPAHSSAGFKVRHLGISSTSGSFGEWTGEIEFDPADVAKTSATATIRVASIDTDDEKRDQHLRSDDFFNAEAFPEITFKSIEVSDIEDDTFKLHGNLTIRDVTKPVVLDVEVLGVITDPWGNNRAGFTATTKIDRRDFNVKWNKALDTGGFLVGDAVKITLEVEAIQEKQADS